ncbi:hypothetical protein OOJ91_06230 [Micromonospora lupini]|uniref:hypothetical protein n=1 Tax=Micromonospora lupini TaxID=285679 RepID=UPI0022599CCC|nr:hypothetical protein [Micromonospora lupini]MCX5065474.1 hypothetical protein [Micromonospora lupini]
MSLFDHALRLHREDPDSPLFRDGAPYPDDAQHRGRKSRSQGPDDRRRSGADVAAVLDAHFADPSSVPGDLVGAVHDLDVPIHRNDHIAAAACRVGAERVRQTGRWLVQHATDRCAATVGLALLGTVWDEDDIPLIKTIGLLSNHFGPLAAHAMERRRGGSDALLWLAERVTGWGRVYVVESLCKVGSTGSRSWMLRRACDGDYLNRYFAGEVATAAHLHEAITAANPDREVIDHTGLLLTMMADSAGVGVTLDHYPPAPAVLQAHCAHAGQLDPSVERYLVAAELADYLNQTAARRMAWPEGGRERVLGGYLAVLDRDDWCTVARAGLAAGDQRVTWLARTLAPRLNLRAFTDAVDR